LVIHIKCGTDERRQAVRNSKLNGIDYLEVFADLSGNISRALLLLHCFKTIQLSSLDKTNVSIYGGTRITGIIPEWAQDASTMATNLKKRNDPIVNDLSPEEKSIITSLGSEAEYVFVIRPNNIGDFSTYTIQLVSDSINPDIPPPNFDAILSKVDFSFKMECQSGFDCKQEKIECLPSATFPEPVIDYMAKDYSSFRKLMLDRLSIIAPDWEERNPSDMGIALVELLAFVGDQISYSQDAHATEAYLGTARSRISLRRHARLLDYSINEGCNARAWVFLKTSADELSIPQGTRLLTGADDDSSVVSPNDFDDAISNGAECFQTMHDITLHTSSNKISFYTWGETRCCLPSGATSATLLNDKLGRQLFSWDDIDTTTTQFNALKDFLKEHFSQVNRWINSTRIEKLDGGSTIKISTMDAKYSLYIKLDNVDKTQAKKASLVIDSQTLYNFMVKKNGKLNVYVPLLKIGDVIIFEETRSPTTVNVQDADTSHRQAVRLTSVLPSFDELYQKAVLEISWADEDALTFPLCLNTIDPVTQNTVETSIARGNIVLADHGFSVDGEKLPSTPSSGIYRPQLSKKPLTFIAPFDLSISAFSVLNYDARNAKPSITLDGANKKWHPSPNGDLLESDEFATEFVVEIENDGTTFIRFGDSRTNSGLIPPSSTDVYSYEFTAKYRVGNGTKGNVGSETITRIVGDMSGIELLRNPMPSQGGAEPETMEEIRQYAPSAFRTQERAVTEADYEEVLLLHKEVMKAFAQIRWTGSWYTVFVAIERHGGKPVDVNFKNEIYGFLDTYRLAGYDIEITGPAYVPLDIEMTVYISSDCSRSYTERELLDAFSNRDLGNGNYGFFYPDNFTFGQPVFLSQIYKSVMKIVGTSSVSVTTFQRLAKPYNGELEAGVVKMAPSEIARLDNDPNFPENGKIVFILEGGL